MLNFGPLAFAAPWMLLGLLGLPLLWWLLRLMPPAPRRIPFPAIRLLFGLTGEETTPQAAPWWLTVLRLSIAALVVFTAARPILNPDWTLQGEGPVILAIDDGWAAAPEWEARMDRASVILDGALRNDRAVHLILGAPPADGNPLEPARLLSPGAANEILGALEPKPWPVDRAAMTEAVRALAAEGIAGEVFWFSDGLEGGQEDGGASAFAAALADLGPLTVLRPDLALGPLTVDPPARGGAQLTATVRRAEAGAALTVPVIAFSDDDRPLFRADAVFDADAVEAEAVLDMPIELRNDVARLVLEDRPGAGAAALLDERWSRRPVGILTDVGSREALPLLSEVYFLDRALRPLGDVSRGALSILLKTPQSVLLLPDETVLDQPDADRLSEWVDAGGMLIRFAGPRLAVSVDDALKPVDLRSGGRQLSGAMLWTEPARIGKVAPDGPFAGIRLPEDIEITRQVLAEPSLELDGKTWMRLEDDTPLVTAEQRGDGWIVLIHTTANTEWSNLALSGLFVDMLERLSALGRGVRDAAGERGLAAPYRLLDGFGRLGEPQNSARPVDVGALDELSVSAAAPPGFYGTQAVRAAVNLGPRIGDLTPIETLPDGVRTAGFEKQAERPLTPYLLLAALALLALDTVLTALIRGFPMLRGRQAAGTAAAFMALVLVSVGDARAQDQSAIPLGAQQTTLAYVVTGDREIDRVSEAGLRGLSEILRQRTAVEAGEPVGVDVQEDELAFYPLLYWPVVESQQTLSAPAVDRLNRFMASGGVILFDTRDGHLANTKLTPGSDVLRRLARQLVIPQIAAVPPDHVLTRSFYLMQSFPGRWDGGSVWVETGASASNDGVSPVVVGDADWAAAWAVDKAGRHLFPMSTADERQRELAYRFGVNLVMYTLTGNYKADQVHIPSILERLGQ